MLDKIINPFLSFPHYNSFSTALMLVHSTTPHLQPGSLVDLAKVKNHQDVRNETWATHTSPLGFMVHGKTLAHKVHSSSSGWCKCLLLGSFHCIIFFILHCDCIVFYLHVLQLCIMYLLLPDFLHVCLYQLLPTRKNSGSGVRNSSFP